MTDSNTLDQDGLPTEFWSVPEKFIEDPNLRFLHSEMCSRLRQENPGADSLELMAIERIATLYFYMRSREAAGAGAMRNDAAYKDMLKLFTTMATDLRKNRIGAQDANEIREEILGGVSKAINSAFKGLDPEVVGVAKKRIADQLSRI